MQNIVERIRELNIGQNLIWGIAAFGFIGVLLILTYFDTSTERFSQIVASGLYQGMLYFMVAAGLSIIFGLMDVLNLAQGALFMMGAYIAFDVLTSLPTEAETDILLTSVYVVTLTPILIALIEAIIGWFMRGVLRNDNPLFQPRGTLGQKLGIAVLIGVPFGLLLGIIFQQETVGEVIRVIGAIAVSLIVFNSLTRNIIWFTLLNIADQVQTRLQRGIAVILNNELPPYQPPKWEEEKEPFERIVLLMSFTAIGSVVIAAWLNTASPIILRLGLAVIAAVVAGVVAGVLMERFFIRPTYVRPLFQIVLTFGLALLIREAIISRYGDVPVGTLRPYLPEYMTGVFEGTTIFRYWGFLIAMGFIMMIAVQLILQRTRIGIIIRAGVQDSEMVEALGVNVRLIFTIVFALGSAIAALGGVISGGFLNIGPSLGDAFLLQAIAVVIIGGLGSYAGTAIASILVGITRAVASYFSSQTYNTDGPAPVIVLIMLCVVLLIKPSGLFGKEH